MICKGYLNNTIIELIMNCERIQKYNYVDRKMFTMQLLAATIELL